MKKVVVVKQDEQKRFHLKVYRDGRTIDETLAELDRLWWGFTQQPLFTARFGEDFITICTTRMDDKDFRLCIDVGDSGEESQEERMISRLEKAGYAVFKEPPFTSDIGAWAYEDDEPLK